MVTLYCFFTFFNIILPCSHTLFKKIHLNFGCIIFKNRIIDIQSKYNNNVPIIIKAVKSINSIKDNIF
jgi:hypothetical protein